MPLGEYAPSCSRVTVCVEVDVGLGLWAAQRPVLEELASPLCATGALTDRDVPTCSRA
jgi:hypothetical protein